jgi:hypothetical protein
MFDLQRMAYVAENYAQLQGLRLVPLATCFLGSAAWRAGLLAWLPGIAGRGAQVWFLSSIALALIVSFPIGARYRRRLGHARPRALRTGALTLSGSAVYIIALTALPPNRWHISIPMVFTAVVLASVGLANHGMRRHYLGIAAACVAFAVAPVVGASRIARETGLDLLIGVGLLVAGLGDHLVLQRMLQDRAPEGVPHGRST